MELLKATRCDVEGNKEYRKVYDRGNCVKVSPLIINDYLGRRKSAGSDKAPSIYKIMTKEKEVEEE